MKRKKKRRISLDTLVRAPLMIILSIICLAQMVWIIDLKTFRGEVEVCEMDCGCYEGIDIPKATKVFVVQGTDNLKGTEVIKWFYGLSHKNTLGLYNDWFKEIQVLYREGLGANETNMVLSEDAKETLRHEIAHYNYTTLSDSFKNIIQDRYDLFCQNPDEFYAYTMATYGEIK